MSRTGRKSAKEARNQFPDLLEAAQRGHSTIITKHGRPVAVLVPVEHRVTWWECEEVFFNKPRPTFDDVTHFRTEQRFYILGQTNAGRWLFVSFTIRNDLIRPISARNMNAWERKLYDRHSKKNPEVQ